MNKVIKKIAGSAFAVAIALTGAVALTSCGESNDSATASDGIIRAYNCEPQHQLIPGDTGETCGGDVIDLVFAKLITIDKDGKPQMEVAKSIDTTDSKTFTITIDDGRVFSDGTPVTSDSFIDAWNYTANAANAQNSASFFEVIEGYDKLNPEQGKNESDDEYTARISSLKGEKLTGLEKVDDKTFKVTLNEPSATFLLRLCYAAFSPLPKVAFDSEGNITKEFGEKPVGNGPYNVESWEHDQKITVRKSATYKGGIETKNNGVDLLIYAGNSVDTALNDIMANNIDALESTGGARYKAFKDNENITWSLNLAPQTDTFEIPYYLDHFAQDEEGALRRQAISYAIDRQAIRDMGDGTGTDAIGFCPDLKVLSGCDKEVEGSDVFKYNPTKAKEAWAKADAISKWVNPKLDYYYNGDSGGKEVYEALVNSYKDVLGIEGSAIATPDFKSLLKDRYAFAVKGAYRTGWFPDYPSVENYLEPISKTGASSNTSKYSNPDFDALLDKGAQSATIEEANNYFWQAENIAAKDLPQIVVGDGTRKSAFSKSIETDSIKFSWNGGIDYASLVKK